MSRPWNADFPLTHNQAADLLEAQFPVLSPVCLQPLGEGWDNAAYLVNGAFVFRFPRRKLAADLIKTECEVLPLLASHLPLAVPVPAYIGTPTAAYAPLFAGYRFLTGTTACRFDWTEEERAENTESLASFLKCLHSIPVSAEMLSKGPKDTIQRANIQMRAERLIARLRDNGDFPVHAETLIRLAEELADTPPHAGPLFWVHGDLYARHLLVDEERRVCGVIDWGDVHLGDPALDLSIAHSFLPPQAHRRFREAYGFFDEAAWNRARFRSLHYGVILVDYGREAGDEAIRKVGEQALYYAMSEV